MGKFAEPLGRAPCGRTERHPVIHAFVQAQDGVDGGGFSSTRAPR